MNYPLTLVEFKSWLESKKEDEVVGDCIKAKEALQIVNNLYTCTVCNKYNPEGTSCEKESCPW